MIRKRKRLQRNTKDNDNNDLGISLSLINISCGAVIQANYYNDLGNIIIHGFSMKEFLLFVALSYRGADPSILS